MCSEPHLPCCCSRCCLRIFLGAKAGGVELLVWLVYDSPSLKVGAPLAPALIVWEFGLWSGSVVGRLTYGEVALLGGLLAGVAL